MALRNGAIRSAILAAVPSPSIFTDTSGILAVAGRAAATCGVYGRELTRLQKFSLKYGFPRISNPGDVSVFLGDESRVLKYIGFLANSGFAFATAHKILFSLRACTIAPGVPEPPPFTRYTDLVMKGYEAVVIPAAARPIITVAMYHFCARTSLDDILKFDKPVGIAMEEFNSPYVRVARWRALAALAYFGALRRSEYLGSSLLCSSVSFDAMSMEALRGLSGYRSMSVRSLWRAVVDALHPNAMVAINIEVSKTNARPEKRLIQRDSADPTVCPVAALALWVVLMGRVQSTSPFFAMSGSDGVKRGPSAADVVEPLHHYLLASTLLDASEVANVNLHAFRHGGATGAILGGASREQSKCLGRWRGNSDAIYVATTKDRQGLAAASAISRALAIFSETL